jgi:hypothetical protein
MVNLTRDQLKRIFKKERRLRLPKNLEEINFSELNYFGWIDLTDYVMYTVAEYNGKVEGIKWDITRPDSTVGIRLEMCEICKQHRKTGEVVLISAKTRRKDKGVNYMSRGHYVCYDSTQCNQGMKNREGLEHLFSLILN